VIEVQLHDDKLRIARMSLTHFPHEYALWSTPSAVYIVRRQIRDSDLVSVVASLNRVEILAAGPGGGDAAIESAGGGIDPKHWGKRDGQLMFAPIVKAVLILIVTPTLTLRWR